MVKKDINYSLGFKHFKDNDHVKAVEHFKNVDTEEYSPREKSEIYHLMALSYAKMYKIRKADRYFEISASSYKYDGSMLFNKAYTYYCLEKYKKALKEINRALDREPSNPRYWYYRGHSHIKLNDRKKAHWCYKHCLNLNSMHENPENCNEFRLVQKRHKPIDD